MFAEVWPNFGRIVTCCRAEPSRIFGRILRPNSSAELRRLPNFGPSLMYKYVFSCRSYVKPKWKRHCKISRPILAYRPRPITAHFFEVPNKTWINAYQHSNRRNNIACSITIDARVWVILYISRTSQHINN